MTSTITDTATIVTPSGTVAPVVGYRIADGQVIAVAAPAAADDDPETFAVILIGAVALDWGITPDVVGNYLSVTGEGDHAVSAFAHGGDPDGTDPRNTAGGRVLVALGYGDSMTSDPAGSVWVFHATPDPLTGDPVFTAWPNDLAATIVGAAGVDVDAEPYDLSDAFVYAMVRALAAGVLDDGAGGVGDPFAGLPTAEPFGGLPADDPYVLADLDVDAVPFDDDDADDDGITDDDLSDWLATLDGLTGDPDVDDDRSADARS